MKAKVRVLKRVGMSKTIQALRKDMTRIMKEMTMRNEEKKKGKNYGVLIVTTQKAAALERHYVKYWHWDIRLRIVIII